MAGFFGNLIGEFFQKIEYGIVHMNLLQWTVVAVVAVVVGFLMLKSTPL